MKPTAINVQITKSPRQYEAVRLSADATLEEGENMAAAIKTLKAQLEQTYAEMIAKPAAAETKQTAAPAPAPAAAPAPSPAAASAAAPAAAAGITRERLTFEDPRLQQAVARMERNPEKKVEIYNNMLKYFDPDEGALKVLKTAAALV